MTNTAHLTAVPSRSAFLAKQSYPPTGLRRRGLTLAISGALTLSLSPIAGAQAFPATFDLSTLDGTTGFRLDGAAGDRSGPAINAAGDVNGDGIDDLIVGAPYADPNNNSDAGSSYVVFGKDSGFDAAIDMSSLDGTTGFRLDGEAAGDRLGAAVGGAGDVNGDGIDDLIVGAALASPNGAGSGSSYVVFGKRSGFAATINLSSLDGTTGFRLDGAAAVDGAGGTVSAAGDVNGDRFGDLIVGASGADPNGFSSGSSYVVFGKNTRFDTPFDLSSLNGANGFRLDGEAKDHFSGASIGAAGDINGDGFDDLVVGAFGAQPNGEFSGSSYVVFGKSTDNTEFEATIELASLDGTTGFRLDGETEGDFFGLAVAGAGDVNGDDIHDLLVGAPGADTNGSTTGSSYVVFGKDTPFAATIDLAGLDGVRGFRLDGEARYDFSGSAVSGAGDFNGDGIDDLIIGAYGADPNGSSSGSSYVVFGKSTGFDAAINLSSLDGSNGFRLDGEQADDVSGLAVSAGGDVNGDGGDDLIIGALGTDLNGSESGSSYVIFGSSDLIFADGFE